MKTENTKSNCKSVRARLSDIINSYVGFKSNWLQKHIASCPRCQKRLTDFGRVNLALSLVKSHPHRLDLWMRANTQAISVLKHSLRNIPKAQKLKSIKPEPSFIEKSRKYRSSIVNAAACLAVLFLMKTGVFSSMNKFQTGGTNAMRSYYATHVGTDIADEIFPGSC
ncbi:MAG: hypothetical protein ACYS18_00440 [Planctomycetota bacterium]|jgi:hypothetical protein